MRHLIVASLLGMVLSTPAFAADPADGDNPQIGPIAAAAAAATSVAATGAATTTANTESVAPVTFTYGRPSALPALYVASALLQGYDAFSTMKALKSGAHEANPFMQHVVKSPAAFIAVKASVTTASVMAAEQLWKNNHRAGAIGLMIASNAMMGMVAAHNARVIAGLE
jgi:hypothetical protein